LQVRGTTLHFNHRVVKRLSADTVADQIM
jgi:hypothetical protein